MKTLALEIHASNVAAGWWPENRNRPEILMLIVSEVAEASEGHLTGCADDKLPHLPMFSVELADTAIRLFDVIGADAADDAWKYELISQGVAAELLGLEDSVDTELMLVVRCVSTAMEAHRKGRTTEYNEALWRSLAAVYAIAGLHGVPLDDIIAEKRAFNAIRPDHKPENRAAAGGKAY